MGSNRIHYIALNVQATMEGATMFERESFKKLIHRIIREYKKVTRDGYEIDFDKLYTVDQLLLLSYVLEIEEYEYAIENPTRRDAFLDEYSPVIQKLLEENLGEVYAEDMQDRGMVANHRSDNGEVYWSKRYGTYD